LIKVLLDEDAELGDRDDAALDLAKYDDPDAEAALAQIACADRPDDDLADTAGQALAEIWCRRGRVSPNVLLKLCPISLEIALGTMQALCEEVAVSAREYLGTAGSSDEKLQE
jgi:hypothetical protein